MADSINISEAESVRDVAESVMSTGDKLLSAFKDIGVQGPAQAAYRIVQKLTQTDYIIQEELIQRMLFLCTDLVSSKIQQSNRNHGITLMAGADIDNKTKLKVLRNQSHLFSDTIIPDGQTAFELFQDNETDVSIDAMYYIKNYVTLFLNIGGTQKAYYFDIDEANVIGNGKFFISKVIIKNTAKTTFTLKASYQITLKVNYTSFDDLLEKNITVYETGGGGKTKIALMHILFKFFDVKGLPAELKHSKDESGVMFTQSLQMRDNERFNRFKKILDTNHINKTYHLTYHKHNFDAFKNSDPFYKFYENELTIEYIAYESTGDSNQNSIVPVPNTNLFKLVLTPELQEQISQQRNRAEALQAQLSLCKTEDLHKFSGDYAEQLAEASTQEQQKLQNLVLDTGYSLIYGILNNCRRYSYDKIPNSVLNVYVASDSKEKLKELFNPINLAKEIGGILIFGAVTGGVGLIEGAIALGIGAYQVISALNSKKLVSKTLSYTSVRAAIEPLDMVNEGFGTGDQYKENIETKVGTALGSDFQDPEKNKLVHEEFMTKHGFGTALPTEENLGETFKISFTTFGEILKIVKTLTNKTNFITGGYIVETSPGSSTYINYADIPITIKSLATFLYNQIIRTERGTMYDTDVFIRDCYEQLVKKIIYDGSAFLQSKNMYISKDMKITTSIHKCSITDILLKNERIDITGQDFNNFRNKFFKSKNFDLSKDKITNNLYNIYCFGSVEETSLINFYKEYKSFHGSESTFNTKKFQKYIAENHLMPCVLTKKIGTTESILKSKYLNFSRVDNANLKTALFLSGYGVIRQPYNVKAEMKCFMQYFIDLGSMFFVAPPANTLETETNMFGYGGLYGILSAQTEYHFQRIQSDILTIPTFESKYSIEAMAISPGDFETNPGTAAKANSQATTSALCSSPVLERETYEDKGFFGKASQDFQEFFGMSVAPTYKVKASESAINAYVSRRNNEQ